jgi:hypothetical protein
MSRADDLAALQIRREERAGGGAGAPLSFLAIAVLIGVGWAG